MKNTKVTKSASSTVRPVAVATKLPRNSKGQFVSPKAPVKNARNSKNTTQIKSSANLAAGRNSSFISSMVIENDTVLVVMSANPKVTYVYKPTMKGLAQLKTAKSLGSAYNRHLKGREIARTIYK